MNELLLWQYQKKEKKWLNAGLYALIIILMLLIIFMNLFTLCLVDGTSMANTLSDKQHVLVLNGKNPKTGEIVTFSVFDDYDDTYKLLIKRVIATEGETIAFVCNAGSREEVTYESVLYLYYKQGKSFYLKNEEFIAQEMLCYKFFYQKQFSVGIFKDKINYIEYPSDEISEDKLANIKVPKDSYFVMGDNRNNSKDSRTYGFIKKEDMRGRAGIKLKKDSFIEKLIVFFYTKRFAG